MHLINILILDDESFIVDWISNLLEEQEDIHADIYRAYTATQAIGIIDRTRIDILITDIRMPDMDGITLSQITLSRWPTCKILLLTAHADFEYAQHAINTGIVGYILKNQKDSFILQEVRRSISLLEKEVNQQKNLENAQRVRDAYHDQLKNSALSSWLHGRYENKEDIHEFIELLGFDKKESYCLFIAKINSLESAPDTSPNPYHVKAIILHYIHEFIAHYAVHLEDELMIWILQPKEEDHSRFISWLQGTLEVVQQACMESYHLPVSFIIGTLTEWAAELSERYMTGKILARTIDEQGYIRTYNALSTPCPKTITTATGQQTEHHISMLKASLDHGKRTQFMKSFENLNSVISSGTNWNDPAIIEIYYSSALVLIHYINQNDLAAKLSGKYSLVKLSRPWLHPSWAEAYQYLHNLAIYLFDLHDREKQQSTANIIHDVENYIDQHIREDISLTALSDIVGYNSSYLSRIFSEKTGNTISNYIARQKMRLIEHLMDDKDLSINDIADQSGFSSRTYFNYFVKRNTGKTPSKYRASLNKC